MKLDYAIFAIGAEVSPEGRLHLFGGEIGGVALPTFPSAPMSLTLVIKLLASPSEVGRNRTLSLTYKRRGDSQPSRHCQEMPVAPDANRLDRLADSGVVVVAMMGVEFEQAGVYEFGIEVDGEVLRSVPFYVSLAQTNPIDSPNDSAIDSANARAETARK